MKEAAALLSRQKGVRVEFLTETTSTNDEARDRKYSHGDIIVAASQSAGRGQRGNSWTSRPGDNLTFSVVLQPRFLPADRQFLLSQTISLAITDTLRHYDIGARIKWPNDIYAGDSKIAGILIENDISGANLSRSIAGIGLNVNQKEFPSELPNPVSMYGAAGRRFSLAEVLGIFIDSLSSRYDQLSAGYTDAIDSDYHQLLYRRNIAAAYRLADGTGFNGTLRGVAPSGELKIEHPDLQLRTYLFKEIEFVI